MQPDRFRQFAAGIRTWLSIFVFHSAQALFDHLFFRTHQAHAVSCAIVF